MFEISLNSMVLLYMGLLLGTVIPLWIWSNRPNRRRKRLRENMGKQNCITCEICQHTYIDSNLSTTARCPQCGYINDRPKLPL